MGSSDDAETGEWDVERMQDHLQTYLNRHGKMSRLERRLWPRLPENIRPHDTRILQNNDDRWCLAIPIFEQAKTVGLGVESDVLAEYSIGEIQGRLEEAGLWERVRDENLLVATDEEGNLRVDTWDPDTEDAWFTTPADEHFVAFKTHPAQVGVGSVPEPQDPFLSLRSANWSMAGPRNPQSPSSYSIEDFLPFLREHGHC